jgi:hypothetical protein
MSREVELAGVLTGNKDGHLKRFPADAVDSCEQRRRIQQFESIG